MSKELNIEQVRAHTFQNKDGFRLIAVVSRMIERDRNEIYLDGDVFNITKTTPLDCYYISTYYSGDKTIWETYDRLKAQDVQTVLDEIENNFKSNK